MVPDAPSATCTILTLILGVPLMSQAQALREGQPTSISATKVEAWAEETFTDTLTYRRATGAVVSVVKDGRMLFAKGYGLADIETGAPATSSTRVRIGSITKTFTATLVAQLIETGRIESLDDPVNRYLDRIQLPKNRGVDITLRHLLTHTAGFEDRFYSIAATEPISTPASADMIKALRPAYIRPAGDLVVYSNFGVAVLGWLIEDLTNSRIDERLNEELLAPLGMSDTRLLLGIDPPPDLAKPGLIDNGRVVSAVPYQAINPAVGQTGSLVSSARDMARYMNAQLGSEENSPPWLGQPVIERMQEPLAQSASDATKLGMVWFLDDWGGQRTVSHGGNWAGFHSWVLLLPSHRTGIFVSVVGEAAPKSVGQRFLDATFPALTEPRKSVASSALPFIEDFLLHFLGPKRPLPSANVAEQTAIEDFAGVYRNNRRAFSTIEALSSLVYFGADTLAIRHTEDGLYLGQSGPWRAGGHGRFILAQTPRPQIVFKPRDESGSARPELFVPDLGIYSYQRIAWIAHPKFHAIAIHILLPFTLFGLLPVFLLDGKIVRAAGLIVAASGGLMISCALVGLDGGQTLMSSYYAGHPERLMVFVLAANALTLASVLMVLSGLRAHGGNRAALCALGAVGLSIGTILAGYNGIGMPQI